jgi:putative hydrolase of the HAD superfamily
MLKTAFEVGRVSLDGYVQKTVFHRSRAFAPDDFKLFMYAQSQPLPEALDWTRALAATGKYRLYTLNNESRELHEYRVRTFRLREVFGAFFTSCYLGSAKPDEEIYLHAMGISGCTRHQAVFIDDRAVNVEAAAALGLHAIHYKGLDALRAALREFGVEV